MENYDILNKIGSGSFAKVYAAIHKPTGKKVALKAIQKKSIATEKLRQRLVREIENMKILKHGNIVEYIEQFETDKELFIAMEYLPGGELFDYIAERQGLSEAESRKFFQQIAAAVGHCHKNHISHRDLKLENIMLSRDNKPKLVDFGFSKQIHSNPMLATYCGSTLYASPEMIFGKAYRGPECDIWSLGVILFCMLTACMPFDDQNWGQFVTCIDRSDYPEPENVSENVKHLLSRMFDPCARTRATIDEVLNHPWLRTKKTSLQLPVKSPSARQRRMGISHSKSDAFQITTAIIGEATQPCSCQCHLKEEGKDGSRQDSAIRLHCEDCEPMSPLNSNNKRTMKKHNNFGQSTVSICSSGYSSSTESLNSEVSPITPTKATIMSFYGCSECLEPANDENIDLVFA